MLHDPLVRDFEKPFTDDLKKAVEGADALILVTAHRQYKDIDLMWLKEAMKTHVIIDGRNFFDGDVVRNAGFIYKCIGKG